MSRYRIEPYGRGRLIRDIVTGTVCAKYGETQVLEFDDNRDAQVIIDAMDGGWRWNFWTHYGEGYPKIAAGRPGSMFGGMKHQFAEQSRRIKINKLKMFAFNYGTATGRMRRDAAVFDWRLPPRGMADNVDEFCGLPYATAHVVL